MKKEDYFFSIILATYNRSNLISKAIESVLNQTFQQWELIIVIDGSTDDTLSVCQKYTDKRIKIYCQKRSGQGSAANFGIIKAKGNFICFLDDDDYYLRDHLSSFYKTYERLVNKNVILRNGFSLEKNGQRTKSDNYSKKCHLNPVRFATFHMCSVCSLSIPKDFLHKDNFPTNFIDWLDTHLILRLLAKHPFIQNENYTYIYVIHSSMGSLRHLKEKKLLVKAENNILAMKDFQEKNPWIINKYLRSTDFQFIIAEKYLMYSIKAIKNDYNTGFKLFFKSLSNLISVKLSKNYIYFFILVILTKTHTYSILKKLYKFFK